MRLPAPNGGEDVYVAVDIERLNPGFFRQLYMRIHERDGSSKYRPVLGYEHLFDAAPDMREVLAALNERLEDTLTVLTEADVDLAAEARGAFQKLGELVKTVNLGDQDAATHIVNEIGYLIMGATAKAVEMHRAAVEAKAQARSTYEVVAGAHKVREELDSSALEHAAGVEQTLKAFDALATHIAALRAHHDELRDAFQSTRDACNESVEPWASAWRFLGEGDDCFTMRAFDYSQMDGDFDEAARADIEEARQYLAACDLRIKSLRTEQRASSNLQTTSALVDAATSAATRYQQANSTFRQHLARVGEDVVTRGLITRAEYDRVKSLHGRHASDLDTHAQSIRSLERECGVYMDAKGLNLPARLTRVLDETRAFLDSIEFQEPPSSEPARPSIVPAARPSAPPPAAALPASEPDDEGEDGDDNDGGDRDSNAPRNPTAPKPALLPGDDKLAEKLYELVLCVGSYRREAPHAATFKSLYNCVAELDIVPREDVDRVYRLVQELSRETGERQQLGHKDSFPVEEQRQLARKTTSATWLSWHTKFHCIRLTRAGQDRAEKLLHNYKLTEDRFVHAWKAMRERAVAKEEEYRTRKKSASTPPEVPTTP